jgi:hypothetical protein
MQVLNSEMEKPDKFRATTRLGWLSQYLMKRLMKRLMKFRMMMRRPHFPQRSVKKH